MCLFIMMQVKIRTWAVRPVASGEAPAVPEVDVPLEVLEVEMRSGGWMVVMLNASS